MGGLLIYARLSGKGHAAGEWALREKLRYPRSAASFGETREARQQAPGSELIIRWLFPGILTR